MGNTHRLLIATAGLAFAAAAVPTAAFAEEGEIMVYGRKKEESILKVPVVQNVLTEQALETYQVNSLQDITTRIPGLVSGNAVLAIGEQMSLRGVGSNSLDQGVDQSVSLNIDGLQLSHGLAYRAASFDLQQVEVLKGPQALYFGKNSTAGVISFRSADPGDTLEVKGRIGYEFEAREKRGELIFSAPLSDTVGIRIAGLYSDSKGIFRNRATAITNWPGPGTPNLGARDPKYKRVGGGESWLTRFTLLWKPSDNFTARLKVNLARDDYRQGGLTQLSACPDGKGALPPLFFPYYHPNEDCKYDKTFYMVDLDPAAFPGVKNNGTPFLDLKQDFGTLELTYDVSDAITLTSVSGYYKSYAETMINGTSTGYAGPAISAENDFRRREFTQELRLDTDFASPFNFTLGAFYQDGRVQNAFKLGGNTHQFLPAVLIQGVSTFSIDTYSLFAQGRFQATPAFEIAAGARWVQEKRKLLVTRFGAPVVLAPGSDRLNSKNWSPEVTLTYTPSDTLTVFAAFKQAYKSGSFNIVIPGAAGEDKSFGDEKVVGGEMGVKSRLFDRQLSFDIAGYYYRYSGLQTGVNEPAQGGLPV
ncbi:MAG: TonB-dependent receptor, partial [Novosphingobium sp.]|nr:TonB-dependent receptor [Novosphingobium sp.]